MVLDGAPLRLPDLRAVASGARAPAGEVGLARARAGHELAVRLSRERPVYGRSTGVGANRDTATSPEERYDGPGTDAGDPTGAAPTGAKPSPTDPTAVRLLRSHAAGTGPPVETPTLRVALTIRANQLLAGGSGASADLAIALAELAAAPDHQLPVVHRHGSLGTGDLTALAEVGLALLGERPRADGTTRHTCSISVHEALPLLSSNAFSLADAALGALELGDLTTAATTVSALTFVALRGNLEAVGPAVARATPFPGAARTAERVREFVADDAPNPAQLQDFFGLRAWPQAHGPVLDELARLTGVVEAMAGAPAENPLVLDGTISHQGSFHATYLTLAADTALLALARSAEAVGSRISHLLTGEVEGLPRFLAGPEPGSSGLMIAEYVAGAALARIRAAAGSPASVLSASVSLGIEDVAGMAPVAVARLRPAAEAYAELVATELVCAVRALRLHGKAPAGPLRARVAEPTGPLLAVLELCASLPAGTDDRDLAPDLAQAQALLPRLATP